MHYSHNHFLQINGIMSSSKTFFNLPAEYKEKFTRPENGIHGYEPPEKEKYNDHFDIIDVYKFDSSLLSITSIQINSMQYFVI